MCLANPSDYTDRMDSGVDSRHPPQDETKTFARELGISATIYANGRTTPALSGNPTVESYAPTSRLFGWLTSRRRDVQGLVAGVGGVAGFGFLIV